MSLRKTLIVTKYLVKNYIINPFLKRFKKFMLSLLALILIVMVVSALALFIHPPEEGAGEETSTSKPSLRDLFVRLGLSKEKIVSMLSTLLTAFFLFEVIRGRSVLPVMEEAEYEVLLAQPISMSEYMLGRLLFQTVQFGLLGIFYFGMIPLVYDLSGGNALKALLFPFSLVLFFLYMNSLTFFSPLLKISFPNYRGFIRILSAAYLALAVVHSVAIGWVSPLLVAPFFLPVVSIVYCVTLSDPTIVVVAYQTLTIFVILALNATIYKLSSRLYPENIVPVKEIYREKAGGKRESFTLYAETPQEALTRLLLYRTFVNKKNLATIVAGLLSAFLLGLILRVAVLPFFSASPKFFSDAAGFLVPLIVAEITSILSMYTLSIDLLPLWVYRVYLLDKEALARRLMLKHSIYYSMVFLAVAVFKTALTNDLFQLGYSVFMLPVAFLISGLSLLLLVYLASRRRVVKVAPTGLYVLEDVAMTIVFSVDFSLIIVFTVLYDILGGFMHAIIFSCVASLIIYTVFSRFLGELLYSVDIVS